MGTAVTRLRGIAQLFRWKPVLSWGGAAFVLGAALAYARTGGDVNLLHAGLAIATVALAQGYASHGLNDAYDWLTGTDKESIGKGTGGSRVIPEGKMTVAGTLAAGVIALTLVLGIGAYFISIYGTPMVVLFAIAIGAPVAYSVPPIKAGYRPFNELVVVVPALAGVVVGTDMVLAGSWSVTAIVVGLMHAFFCISWFVVSRVPDYEPDKRVGKVTSVVYVGRDNAALLASGYLAFALVTAALLAVNVSPVFGVALAGWLWMMYGLSRLDPYDAENASRVRRYNMHLTTANAVVVAVGMVVLGV